MVRFLPFAAYRPASESLASTFHAPPYDVLDSNEARTLSETGENQFLRCNKPEINFKKELNTNQYSDEVYAKGKEVLNELLEEGLFVQDSSPGYYIYSQQMGDHIQYGICGASCLQEYVKGITKKHEKTQIRKEDDRTKLTYAQKANIGPVFLMYKDEKRIDTLISDYIENFDAKYKDESNKVMKYTVKVKTDQSIHTLWPILDDSVVSEIRDAFDTNVENTYIADGHHRIQSAYRVREMIREDYEKAGLPITGNESWQYLLAVCFPASQLSIMPYNRCIKDLNGLETNTFLEKVSKAGFQILSVQNKDAAYPLQRNHIGMCLKGSWYMLKYLENRNHNFESALTNSTSSRCSSVSCNTEPDSEMPSFEEVSLGKENTETAVGDFRTEVEGEGVHENNNNNNNNTITTTATTTTTTTTTNYTDNDKSRNEIENSGIPRIDSALTVTGAYEDIVSGGPSSRNTSPLHCNGEKERGDPSDVSDLRKEEEENSFSDPSPIESLDVEILYHNILKPILNIGNPREDLRIGYIGGIRGNEELERLVTGNNPWGEVSFAMYAISPHDVMDVADCNAIMPPKATWFEPKLRSGLLVKVLDNGQELI